MSLFRKLKKKRISFCEKTWQTWLQKIHRQCQIWTLQRRITFEISGVIIPLIPQFSALHLPMQSAASWRASSRVSVVGTTGLCLAMPPVLCLCQVSHWGRGQSSMHHSSLNMLMTLSSDSFSSGGFFAFHMSGRYRDLAGIQLVWIQYTQDRDEADWQGEAGPKEQPVLRSIPSAVGTWLPCVKVHQFGAHLCSWVLSHEHIRDPL